MSSTRSSELGRGQLPPSETASEGPTLVLPCTAVPPLCPGLTVTTSHGHFPRDVAKGVETTVLRPDLGLCYLTCP